MTHATIIAGEPTEVFTLTREEVEQFAIARRRYAELRALAFDVLVPAIGGPTNPLSGQLYDLLQELHCRTGGFLAQHRSAIERDATVRPGCAGYLSCEGDRLRRDLATLGAKGGEA